MITTLFRTRNQNVFVSFLELLNVKHTKTYSNTLFNEHPHKYNLLGVSKMLSEYNIENAATRIEDKEMNLFNIETPFVAPFGGDFVTIREVTADNVRLTRNGKDISILPQEFNKSWSGVVLLAEKNNTSIELNYKENKRAELLNIGQKCILGFLILITGLFAYVSNSLYHNPGLTLVLAINMIGMYIGYLLVQKQMHIHSTYADKICSLFQQSDCNSVLESKAAKFLGVIGWSEVGLGYFISNVFLVLFFPRLISYLALINIFALPYTVWSVWYQKFKAKQWCPLCLIVQILFWAMFAVNLIFGFIAVPVISADTLLLIACIYGIPFLLINISVPKLSEGTKVEQIKQEINSIKANDEVFLSLLKQQPHYEVERSTSAILLGNPDADILVTILSNPHCGPCSRMHERVENIIEHTDNLCIQYIYSSFEEDLNSSNKFMIAVYLNKRLKDVKEIYAEWFEKGKFSKEDFFSKHGVNIEDEAVEKEFRKHESWIAETGLRATPTILVNGYKLPDNYKIEDLRFFSEL